MATIKCPMFDLAMWSPLDQPINEKHLRKIINNYVILDFNGQSDSTTSAAKSFSPIPNENKPHFRKQRCGSSTKYYTPLKVGVVNSDNGQNFISNHVLRDSKASPDLGDQFRRRSSLFSDSFKRGKSIEIPEKIKNFNFFPLKNGIIIDHERLTLKSTKTTEQESTPTFKIDIVPANNPSLVESLPQSPKGFADSRKTDREICFPRKTSAAYLITSEPCNNDKLIEPLNNAATAKKETGYTRNLKSSDPTTRNSNGINRGDKCSRIENGIKSTSSCGKSRPHYGNISPLADESSLGIESDSDSSDSEVSVYRPLMSGRSSHCPRSNQILTRRADSTCNLTALTESLFANVPPTINFVKSGLSVPRLSSKLQRMLKWRLDSLTPNVVKSIILRSNFHFTKSKKEWIGYFGKQFKHEEYRFIANYQKLNHFPGSFNMGRKDMLSRNLKRFSLRFGEDYDFFPKTYCLPKDYDLLLLDKGINLKWILKPPASARGIGISVVQGIQNISKTHTVLVQRYISDPFLIYGRKFDLRVYVYVSCFNPIRIYVHRSGLVRFASEKYCANDLKNRFIHLTNFSVNKKNEKYKFSSNGNCDHNFDKNADKWSLIQFWNYISAFTNPDVLKHRIFDIIVKTVISCESSINAAIRSTRVSRYSVHELFGFDILLDSKLKPWLLEVNISPSLNSSSQLDIDLKELLVRDMFNVAGWMIPGCYENKQNSSNSHWKTSNPLLTHDMKLFCSALSTEEKHKHISYIRMWQQTKSSSGILADLTPDDVRTLTESEDEFNRKGEFERIFPSRGSYKYLRYFDQSPGYYNILVNEWENSLIDNIRLKKILHLNKYCLKNYHLITGNNGK